MNLLRLTQVSDKGFTAIDVNPSDIIDYWSTGSGLTVISFKGKDPNILVLESKAKINALASALQDGGQEERLDSIESSLARIESLLKQLISKENQR